MFTILAYLLAFLLLPVVILGIIAIADKLTTNKE